MAFRPKWSDIAGADAGRSASSFGQQSSPSPQCRRRTRKVVCWGVLLGFIFLVAAAVLRFRGDENDRHLEDKLEAVKKLKPNSVIRQHCDNTQTLCGINEAAVDTKAFDLNTLKQQFYSKVTTVTMGACHRMKHFGGKGDGGYDVCISPILLKPDKSKCLVYSFGIRNDWRFDEDISRFGCEVHSFDPSIGMDDHIHPPDVHFHNLGLWGDDLVNSKNWTLRRLSTIRKQLKHEERIIDVLKIDIEAAEWPFLRDVLTTAEDADSPLSTVRQLLLEIHTPRYKAENIQLTVVDVTEMVFYADRLDALGFKVFRNRQLNGCCFKFARMMPPGMFDRCCHETFYVNTKL